ncbi:MAG TPA: ComF family protein [Acidobacteriota bacterium]|nr:ComF family protein [Acidobacteriota bacterium]
MRRIELSALQGALKVLGRTLLRGLAPQSCVLCGDWVEAEDLRPLCRPCRQDLPPIPPRICHCCGIPVGGNLLDRLVFCSACRSDPPSFLKARSFGLYRGPLRRLVRSYKFDGMRRIALPLAELLWESYCRHDFEARALVWVPSHPKRVRRRGFDHMRLLGETFAQRCRLPLLNGFKRVRHTPAQSGLSRRQRRINLSNAFDLDAPADGSRVLLLDDIYTTGTTLQEASSTLLRSGAASVEVLTVARVPLYSTPDWSSVADNRRDGFTDSFPERIST